MTAALGAADVSMEIGEEGLRVHLYRQGRVKVAVSPRGVESIFAQWPERAVVDGVSLRASALRAFDRWGEPMRLERETGAAVWVGASRRDSMSTSSRGVSIPGAGDDQRGPLRPRERCQPR
ncbi:MAG TPA: hypothetical protein VEA99_00070 [Gemmatimonadaceae bacterium]|nr:hypothetical protein [Gemmatimonadaceae bacterium]